MAARPALSLILGVVCHQIWKPLNPLTCHPPSTAAPLFSERAHGYRRQLSGWMWVRLFLCPPCLPVLPKEALMIGNGREQVALEGRRGKHRWETTPSALQGRLGHRDAAWTLLVSIRPGLRGV